MELEQPRRDKPPMTTFDEASMECSISFVKALQELKNLRPQLYSAAEYCEKSYLFSEQKEMVLDNLKDYAVRALVNAVDHLGTVAYKLTDLMEQHTFDVSTMELKVSSLNQQLLTCKTYTEKEGLRQHQLLAVIPKHHKHYILPNSVNKKVHFSLHIQTDARQSQVQTRPRVYSSGTPSTNTLSWHLASEIKSTLKSSSRALMRSEDLKTSGRLSGNFQLVDTNESTKTKISSNHATVSRGAHASNAGMQPFGSAQRDIMEIAKPMTPFRSFDNPHREIIRAPVRSKSMMSAFFVKHKTPRLKTAS